MALAAKKMVSAAKDDSETASWLRPTEEGLYLCSFCQYEAKKRFLYCPGCDREMLNHA